MGVTETGTDHVTLPHLMERLLVFVEEDRANPTRVGPFVTTIKGTVSWTTDLSTSKRRNTDHTLRRFTVGFDVSTHSEFEDDGSHETDNRSSSCPESPHVDSIFIYRKSLAHLSSSLCISILRMPIRIVKTVHVHHDATRFVHTIPPLVSYNREYLQTRTEMCLLVVLKKLNMKVILATDGINKLSDTRRRMLWQLQLKTYDKIQLFP